MEALNDIMVYDITQNTWSSVIPTGDIPVGKYGHTACNYQSDKAIVFGGFSSNHVLGDLFIMEIDDSKCKPFAKSLIISYKIQHLSR